MAVASCVLFDSTNVWTGYLDMVSLSALTLCAQTRRVIHPVWIVFVAKGVALFATGTP